MDRKKTDILIRIDGEGRYILCYNGIERTISRLPILMVAVMEVIHSECKRQGIPFE